VSRSTAVSRLPALAIVAVGHVLAIAGFLVLSRIHPPAVSAKEIPALVWLPPSAEAPLPGSLPPADSRRLRAAAAAPKTPRTEAAAAAPAAIGPTPAPERHPGAGIDWAAEASDAAAHVVQEDEESRRRLHRFGAPPPSAAFVPSPHHPAFGWNYAATHRVEALPGGGTLIHLNDNCTLVLFIVIPMIGCSLGRVPASGELFEHMQKGAD
jgi:hypothetical protein